MLNLFQHPPVPPPLPKAATTETMPTNPAKTRALFVTGIPDPPLVTPNSRYFYDAPN